MSQPSSSFNSRKAGGVCGVCNGVFRLLSRDGTLHKHGWNASNRQSCPGSYQLPVNQGILPASADNALLSGPTPISHAHAYAVTSGRKATTSASVAVSNTQTVTTPELFDHPDLLGPLLKHVPRSSRPSCGDLLANLLNNITAQPSNIKYWRDLFSFGSDILAKPSRGGKRHNLNNVLQKRMAAYSDKSTRDAPPVGNFSNPRKEDTRDILAAAVASKIEDGNLKAAIRLICSDDVVAPSSAETLAALVTKHPPAPRIQISHRQTRR